MIKKSKSLFKFMIIAFALALTPNLHSMDGIFWPSPAPTPRPVSNKEAIFLFVAAMCTFGYPLICDAIKLCKKAIR